MRRLSPALLACLLVACDDPETPAPTAPAAEIKVIREVFEVEGAQAQPNPTTGAATPAEASRVRVVRYRLEADPPRPARAIAVMMPGFLGGAGSFDSVARALVRRSSADDALEAWAIDRRSNLLEDHTGLDEAERLRDPAVASRYYFEGAEINGKAFGKFRPQSELSYMSEWGLPLTVGDLRKVIEVVPQAERKRRVVLVGHSLGASIAEAYAAWDFDGLPGHSELASLVLVDGVAGNEGGAIAQSQEEYEQGGGPAPGGFGQAPGVNGIRKSGAYFTLPLLGAKVYPVAAITAMRAVFDPTGVAADAERDKLLRTLLSLKDVPPMTNRAAMGLSFDARTNALSFAAVNCGEAVGPMEEYDSLFQVKLLRPTDPSVTYTWKDYSETSPRDHTSIEELSKSWFEGPGLDFAEWYFPQRLPTDMAVATSLTLAPADWPAALHGIRAFHGRALDLPILAHAAGLLGGDAASFDKLRALAAPVGPDRPAAGEPRSSARAFTALSSPGLSHIDPLLGADDPGSEVAAWYDTLAAWARQHSPAGGVAVARR